ncbi:uncharacterized protein LOC105925526 [Fundulus heteroclitus]|uniref:uncharacterized protein LOC105925526 n=1 Tax=Fundulus heteroclitus TaxID=8078 RepID=UPI00165B5EEC|nr:uncharacterized protein LOC105925526 [Fundulus heteroclitus]
MRNFLQLTVLVLCIHNLICESQTVEVHPNEDITLFCSNISQSATQTEWFRVINRTEPSCISSMYGAEGEASYCNGIQNEKFEMSSNTTTVFLQIKRVDPWDCGLYLCGFYMNKHTVIGNATHLTIKANEDSNDELDSKNKKEADQQTDLMLGILGALTFLLSVAVIILAVKNRKLQTASRVKLQKDRNKNLDSDDLNYTALSFQADSKRCHRPAPNEELQSHVVYAVPS